LAHSDLSWKWCAGASASPIVTANAAGANAMMPCLNHAVLKVGLLVVLSLILPVEQPIAASDSTVLLKKVLGDAIAVHVDSTGASVEYCPDNTCEVFRSDNKQAESSVADFALLYLYYVSDYAALSEFRKSPEATRAAERFLNQLGKRGCTKTSRMETIKCVVRHLGRHHGISLLFVRYDEQVRKKVPKSLEEELSRLK
jgi:hypothetical protein